MYAILSSDYQIKSRRLTGTWLVHSRLRNRWREKQMEKVNQDCAFWPLLKKAIQFSSNFYQTVRVVTCIYVKRGNRQLCGTNVFMRNFIGASISAQSLRSTDSN